MTSNVPRSNRIGRGARAAGLATLALALLEACGSGSEAGPGGTSNRDGGGAAAPGAGGGNSGGGGADAGGAGSGGAPKGSGAGRDAATDVVGADARPLAETGAEPADASGADAAAIDAGDGSTCGNGVKDPGEHCCDAAARAAFDDGLLAYVTAHEATSWCVTPTTLVDQLGLKVDACTANGCAGSPGCTATLSYHDARYGSQTGSFQISTDVDAPIALVISAPGSNSTCTLDVAFASVPYAAVVQPVDDGYALQANVTQAGLGPLPSPQLAGCGALGSIVDTAAGVAEPMLQAQVESAATTLTTGLRAYRVVCGY